MSKRKRSLSLAKCFILCRLLAIGLPIFYVSDATGRNLLGYSTGLYDTINGDGLSNLRKGLIDARVYFSLRLLSLIYLCKYHRTVEMILFT